MYDRTGNYLIVAIVIGLILGIAVPVLFGNGVLPVKFLGDIFLNALKMVAIPLVLCSIVMGINNLGALGKSGKTGLKTLVYFLATTAVAVLIGMVLANLLQPGIGAGKSGMPGPQVISYSFLDWLVAQFPPNIFGAISEFRLLPIVFLAVFLGSVLTLMGPKGKPVVVIIETMTEALMKMVRLVMWFAPLGVFGLVAGQIAAAGGLGRFWSEMGAVSGLCLVVLVGLGIHAIIVLPLILKFLGGKNPVEYAGGMSSALLTALASASSAATLPVAMDCVESKNDVDKRASALMLPLGSAINFNGTALFIGAAAMFAMQAQGWDVTLWSQVVIFVTAVLASIGVAGIPQAGLLALALVLQANGMPVENIGLGLGMLLGVEWFLDRARTVVNVWGNAVGAAVLATTAEIGLVDRRPRPLDRQQRFPRFKVPLRRQDFAGRQKGFETPVRGGDRGPATGKRPETVQPTGMRRQAGPERGRDDRRGPRPPRQEHRDRDFRGSERRDEYKPTAGPVPEAGIEKRPERPERQERPDRGERPERQQRQPFARKMHRGERPGRGTPRETEKDAARMTAKESPKEFNETPVPEPRPEFEVPKFPDKILEELAAPVISEAAKEVVDGQSESSDTAKTPSSETDDFARLDRMVFGGAESPEPTERVTEGTWEPTPEVPTTERTSEYYSPAPVESGGEEKALDRGEPVSEELSTPTEAPPPAEAVHEEEQPAPGETAAAESGDDDEQVQWGRPKRRKLSR